MCIECAATLPSLCGPGHSTIRTNGDGAVTRYEHILSQPRYIFGAVIQKMHHGGAQASAMLTERAHHTLEEAVGELLSTTGPLSDDNLVALIDLNEELQCKQDLLSVLDVKLLEATKDEDIEAEVLQAEETNSTILTAKARITSRLNLTTLAKVTTTPRCSTSPPPVEHPHESITRLPKLYLPQFAGNPLNWQPFWDCFKPAVDSNKSLTAVQKLTYLCAQLQGEASRIIAEFQLTDTSYADSVKLLKDRFGQSYKQIDAHMQVLIDLPGPTNSLPSIRGFYDATESHICSLSALGKTEDSYGSLLVPIILGKLPGKIKQNLARSHGKGEWTINELRTAIRDEIYILEIGSHHTDSHSPSHPTASFFSSAGKPTHLPKGRVHCPFCKGPHSALPCESIKDPNSSLTLCVKSDYVLIVWGTKKYLRATLNTGVTTARESTIQVYVPMVTCHQSATCCNG